MTTFDPASANRTLFDALLDAARTHGRGKEILEDQDRKPMTYGRLILGSLVLGDALTADTQPGETLGLLLPNVGALPVALLGLNAFGRVAALLNFTSGLKNIRSAVHCARVRRVITSRRFIDQAKLDDIIAGLEQPGDGRTPVTIVYLEDVARGIGRLAKLKGLARSFAARWVHRAHRRQPDEAAVVLFTSGTEGTPKGVVLSNRNLIANAGQIYSHAAGLISPADTVLNALPMFHSFGLTAAALMPLLHGLRVVLYPSPLHYRQVPKLIAATRATVLISTDTFLQGYARAAEGQDLASVRVMVAGAERVREQTRALWAKFGAEILEGYGCTECSPVLACNLPGANHFGTVGRLLPGIEARLDPVEGIAEGGRLNVRGPNVMLGYMLADQPGQVVPPLGGWHDTGDIVTIDADGFIAIRGRAKRFAKIGGEMISLGAVETMVSELWPESNHVVISLPDVRKGEQLVLVTNRADADKEELLKAARAHGFPELWVPKAVLVVAEIPVLGSGKVDLPSTMELARRMRSLL